MKIIFAGTPEFAVPALQALLRSSHDVIAVYTQPDRPAGRGRKVLASAVKTAALAWTLPATQPTFSSESLAVAKHSVISVEQPHTLRDPEAIRRLRDLGPDLMVVAAYGLILPPEALAIPRLGCLNIHASLLPRWRGAAPIQRAILAGDTRTGVCIMRMEAGLDTGPVLLERSIDIAPDETAAHLHDRLAVLGADAILEALPSWQTGTLQPTPQPDEGVTYAQKISKQEAQIKWARPAADIARQVRAFNPWPVAFTQWRGETLRIWQASPLVETSNSDGEETRLFGQTGAVTAEDSMRTSVTGSRAVVRETAAIDSATLTPHGEATAAPGTVLAAGVDGIVVTTGAGELNITELQLAGRKTVKARDFINAHTLTGEVFE